MAILGRRRLAPLLLVAALCLTSAFAATVDRTMVRMEQILQSQVVSYSFMGSVLVARDGVILLDRNYGFANIVGSVPNTDTTRFRIGSLTKQFTAAGILLLEERGKLKVDDLVSTYLPDVPTAWKSITLHHLLTHTAGLPNYTLVEGFPEFSQKPATPQQIIALVADKPLAFAPGERFSYSNTNYVVLGEVIEKVSGQSYADFLQDNVFTPLGMQDSGYDTSMPDPRRAIGYREGQPPSPSSYVDMSTPFSAGALYSTTGDLLKWEQGLFGGKVLSPPSLKKMTTAFKDNYAYGVGVTTTGNAVYHDGAINGFNSAMTFYPQSKIVVIALSNVQGFTSRGLVDALGQAAQ